MMIFKNTFLTTCFFLLGCLTAVAQTYPVQVSTVILPPYSVHLSDYTTSDKLAVHVLFNDPVRFELSVKLKVTIEGKNITLSTKPEFNPKPIYLQSGFPERLTGIDLAPYFEPNNLNFQGLDRKSFEQKAALPEGVYRICIEVWEYSQNKKISNTGCSTVWMILNDPPIINYPKNGEKIKILDPQLVVFNWTPRHTGSPNAAFTTDYEFELVEVRGANQNSNNAILTSPPIYTTTTHSTSIYYSIAETPLIPGMKYAFRVKAKAISGLDELDLFKNNGYSEVFTFTYGDQCLTPDAIHLEALNPTSVKATWSGLPAHTSFTVRYKENKDGSEWFEKSSMVPEYTINGLRPDAEYAVQIVGLCGVIANEEIKTYTIKTKKVEESNFACGSKEDKIDISNTTLIKSLSPGQFIESSNFKIALIEVSHTGDGFSGRGIAYIPWFKLAGLKVEFKDIQVNSDKKVIKGNVVSTKSENSNWVHTSKNPKPEDPIDTNTGTGNGNGGSVSGTGSGKDTSTVVIIATHPTITVDSISGNTVIKDDKGNVTVVKAGEHVTVSDGNGHEQVITGGSAQAGSSSTAGNSNGSTGTGGGNVAPVNPLSTEALQLLKDALTVLRKKSDFFPLPQWKDNMNIRKENMEESMAKERTKILTDTYAPIMEFSNPVVLIKEETVAMDKQNIDNDRFKLFKGQEREYNELKIIQIFCQESLSEGQLNVLGDHLLIEDKKLNVYVSSGTASGITKDKMTENIVAAIEQLVKAQL